MRLPSQALVIAALAAATPGCAPEAPPESLTLTPVAAPSRVLVGETRRLDEDTVTGRLLLVTPQDGVPSEPEAIALTGPPTRVVPVPEADAALALSRDTRTVDLVDLEATEVSRTFAVGAPFEALSVAEDGRFALAWFPPDTASAVFHNENEVALLDLAPSLAPSEAVSRRTLPSLGGAPRLVAFSPPVAGPGASSRRYLFALSDEHVAILSADAPSRPERSVPLVSLTTGGDRTPRAVTFGLDADTRGAETLWAIITTAEANAVYALAVTPRADAPAGEPDFDVTLSQLAGIGPGGAATLVSLPDASGGRPRLATLSTNPAAGTATLTDVRTATGRTVRLSTGLDRIVLFEGATGGTEALLYAGGYAGGRSTSTFHVLDLEAFAAGDARAFRTRTTREPFSRVLPIPGSTRFVVLKDGASDAVGILDADTDRVAGFGRTGAIRDLRLESDLGRLYALTSVDGRAFLVSVDLADLHPEVAEVPSGAESLLTLPSADTVATWSPRAGGTLVLWPALETLDAASIALPGLALTGLLR
jgi:hypothetical protein